MTEDRIDTEKGPAYVRFVGRGPRVLVLHGGPGFDHRALVSGFAAMQAHRTLIFFDQLGCGRTPASAEPVTAEATFDHAAAVLDALGTEPIGFVANSWGTVVAAAIAARRPQLRFTETVLVSPIAIDSGGYAEARAAITERIPEAALKQMWAMLGEGASGRDAFAAVSPYYLAAPHKEPPKLDVTAPVYASVDATLGAFDYRDVIERLGPIASIRGALDYIPPDSLTAWLDSAQPDIVLPRVGHFPFFEDPEAFATAVDSIFSAHR